MSYDKLIRWTNKVAIYGIVALLFWFIVFVVTQVFGLKVFREHISQLFIASVVGILVILAAALMLNIMSNLSKISASVSLAKTGDALEAVDGLNEKQFRRKLVLLAIALVVTIAGLFIGDYLSAQKKKSILIQTAQKLISENPAQLDALSQYEFNRVYIKKSSDALGVIKRIDSNFPSVVLLQQDSIDDKAVVLGFDDDNAWDEKNEPAKKQFIFATNIDERAYIKSVFEGNVAEPYFKSENGYYKLFYPIVRNQKTMLLMFSDYQRYGKLGS